MKSHWHATIQQYVDGQSSAEEAAALFNSLNEDAALRALYLDYMNLDMALGAVADAVAVEENESNRMTSLHEARRGAPPPLALGRRCRSHGGSGCIRSAAGSSQPLAHWPGRDRRHYLLSERDRAPGVRRPLPRFPRGCHRPPRCSNLRPFRNDHGASPATDLETNKYESSTMKIITLIALLFTACRLAAADQPAADTDPLAGAFFPPEVVLMAGDQIGLTQEQREALHAQC